MVKLNANQYDLLYRKWRSNAEKIYCQLRQMLLAASCKCARSNVLLLKPKGVPQSVLLLCTSSKVRHHSVLTFCDRDY